jgi:histidine triad (HIT) family protein
VTRLSGAPYYDLTSNAVTPAYDTGNVFAKILRGELPCAKVFEDEHSFVMMDIMPRAPGHCLVIPKAPARNMLDISEASLVAVTKTVRLISRAAIKAFNADGITIHQFNEDAGGQVVFHLHFHVIPRMAGVPLLAAPAPMAERETLAQHAQMIEMQIDR